LSLIPTAAPNSDSDTNEFRRSRLDSSRVTSMSLLDLRFDNNDIDDDAGGGLDDSLPLRSFSLSLLDLGVTVERRRLAQDEAAVLGSSNIMKERSEGESERRAPTAACPEIEWNGRSSELAP
jgi:hypothetical protein